jgi:hypothetical protein
MNPRDYFPNNQSLNIIIIHHYFLVLRVLVQCYYFLNYRFIRL